MIELKTKIAKKTLKSIYMQVENLQKYASQEAMEEYLTDMSKALAERLGDLKNDLQSLQSQPTEGVYAFKRKHQTRGLQIQEEVATGINNLLFDNPVQASLRDLAEHGEEYWRVRGSVGQVLISFSLSGSGVLGAYSYGVAPKTRAEKLIPEVPKNPEIKTTEKPIKEDVATVSKIQAAMIPKEEVKKEKKNKI